MLVRAAHLRKVKLSQFMLRSSQTAAEMELADRTRFVLPPEKWQRFNRALDEAPRSVPRLRKLLAERSVFDPPERTCGNFGQPDSQLRGFPF